MSKEFVKRKILPIVFFGVLLAVIIPYIAEFLANQPEQSEKKVVFSYNNTNVYEDELLPYINYYLKITGGSTNDDKNKAINNYIRSTLFYQYAKDTGITYSDEQLAQYIKTADIFQDNGAFSSKKYDEFISKIGVSKHIFENEIRKDLVVGAFTANLDKKFNIEDYYFSIMDEVLAQKRTIDTLRINLNNIPIDENKFIEQAKVEYNQNRELYRKYDEIKFTKYTYIDPRNQNEDKDVRKEVYADTVGIYNKLAKDSTGVVAELQGEQKDKVTKSSMTLPSNEFVKLLGLNINESLNYNTIQLKDNSAYIDKTEVLNGVITVYNIDSITKGQSLSFEDAIPLIKEKIEKNMKLEVAYEMIQKENKDFSKVKNQYFDTYIQKEIDPLKNDQSSDVYKSVNKLSFNDIGVIEDHGSLLFVKLAKIDKIQLTDEQTKMFKESQNNMYKQFILLSIFDELKRIYNLKEYKKES